MRRRRIVAGLDIPNSGQIYFGDEDASQKTAQVRHVGFVFQNYALFKHLTVNIPGRRFEINVRKGRLKSGRV